ncbi:MAG TPA: hypothetical protein VH482_34950 [Thermomicrobiales bacterium]
MATVEATRSNGSAVRQGGAPTGPPQITPNMRTIDNRFPCLGFTVLTGGLPYFEVLATTDRSLFDPANAGRRSPGTFYTSRQEGGLTPATGPATTYLLPAATLRGFADAVPRPTAIYYTLIAYAGADATGPVFAQPPETLATDAPAVAVSADFRAQTLSHVMGISVERLRRLATGLDESPSDEAADLLEGEDGTSAAGDATTPNVDPNPAATASAVYGDDRDPTHRSTSVAYDDGYGPPVGATAARAEQYDDEDAAWPADDATGWGAALSSTYRPGARPPSTLEDSADPYDEGDRRDEDVYDPGEAVFDEPYADEASVWDGGGRSGAYALDDVAVDGAATAQPLTIDAKRAIVEQCAAFESGSDRFAAVNRDGEFAGRFGVEHPAYGRYHVGLSYGIVQFTQDSGSLGRLLVMMRDRDAAMFAHIFGDASDDLIRVTNAAGPGSADAPDGRSARVQPVAGADLWEEPWVSRFRAAANHVPFQAAQNELASTLYLDPMLRFAAWFGLDSDRALAMVLDRAIQMGTGGARRWIADAVGPIQTPALRQQALAALGHADLRAFQTVTAGLDADGEWGPLSHAALTAALRGLGAASPVPVPTREQMLDAMVRRAAGQPWAHRVEHLRTSSAFGDVSYQL